MSSFQDAKAPEDFIARCGELKIKAKEKENKPLSPLPNEVAPKHPGHYRAPAFSSFERQFGFISENKSALRPSNERMQPGSLPESKSTLQPSNERIPFGSLPERKSALRPSNERETSKTSPTSEVAPNFPQPTPATSELSAAARRQAIAKCHHEIAACYEKLAALHTLEAEDALESEAPS